VHGARRETLRLTMRQTRSFLPRILVLAIVTAALTGAAPSAPPTRFEEGLVSTGFDDAHVSFSPDGKTLYFLRNTPDFAHWTVLVSQREGARWGPARVAPFSGRWNDGDVTITRDGSRLFFISNRPVEGDTPRPDTEIWTMERTSAGWGPREVRPLAGPMARRPLRGTREPG
ncbi:MAG: hypothetical protein ACXWK8_12080, partial [Myxococcaceae bacterium]